MNIDSGKKIKQSELREGDYLSFYDETFEYEGLDEDGYLSFSMMFAGDKKRILSFDEQKLAFVLDNFRHAFLFRIN